MSLWRVSLKLPQAPRLCESWATLVVGVQNPISLLKGDATGNVVRHYPSLPRCTLHVLPCSSLALTCLSAPFSCFSRKLLSSTLILTKILSSTGLCTGCPTYPPPSTLHPLPFTPHLGINATVPLCLGVKCLTGCDARKEENPNNSPGMALQFRPSLTILPMPPSKMWLLVLFSSKQKLPRGQKTGMSPLSHPPLITL